LENKKRRKPKESTITDQSFSKLMIQKEKKRKDRKEKCKVFNINHGICRIGRQYSCFIGTSRDQRFKHCSSQASTMRKIGKKERFDTGQSTNRKSASPPQIRMKSATEGEDIKYASNPAIGRKVHRILRTPKALAESTTE
jgi:hypothetical protein